MKWGTAGKVDDEIPCLTGNEFYCVVKGSHPVNQAHNGHKT